MGWLLFVVFILLLTWSAYYGDDDNGPWRW